MDTLLTETRGMTHWKRSVIYPIHGNDNYYIYGLNHLLAELFTAEPGQDIWLPDIWIISNVRDMFSCIGKLREKPVNVIIGDVRYYRMLSGIPGIGRLFFVEASLAVAEVIKCFTFIVRSRGSCARLNEYRAPGVAAFSARTRKIIGLLLQGCSPHDIARECGIQAKTVSLYKRSVMQRLNVNSTQELVIKSALMKAQW